MSEQEIQTGVTQSPPTAIAEGLPPGPPIHDDRAESNFRINEPTAMQVFFAWEKIRILYNGVITVFFLVAVSVIPGEPKRVEFWPLFWFYAAANVIFCVAPVTENYLSWVGFPRAAFRWTFIALTVLFMAGFIFGSLKRFFG